MEEAYRFIDWKGVFLIAGMLPLGIAMERTGAAALMAEGMATSIESAEKTSKSPDPQPQQQEGEQQQQQEASADKRPEEGNDEQEAMAQMGDDAGDILDEEKENKKQRRMQSAGGHRDVDKDW